MAYWLCVTNEDNWEVVREKRVWGVPERRSKIIEKVAKKAKEACKLVEAGFEYVCTTPDNLMLFRKRK